MGYRVVSFVFLPVVSWAIVSVAWKAKASKKNIEEVK
jgi:hypothetical protein